MSSDTTATGEIPALEPEAFPAAPAARQASGLPAVAPGPAGRDQGRPGSAGRDLNTREPR
jgi:hypothetical protein